MDDVNSLYHRLWTKAVGSADYVKDEWMELERLIRSQRAAEAVASMQASAAATGTDKLTEGEITDEIRAARAARATSPNPPSPPSIGRIVHYTNLGDKDGKFPPEIQAALITGVGVGGAVSLWVFYKTGFFSMPEVSFTDQPAGSDGARGKWCWPARA